MTRISALPDDGSVDVIVDRLVRGRDAPERRARLDRNGVRRRAWAGAGSSPAASRGPTFAAGGAAGAGPTTSSPSRTCSATTAPWAPARSARASAGPWSSTWAGSCPTHLEDDPRRAHRALDDPAYRRFLDELLAVGRCARHSRRCPLRPPEPPSRSTGSSRACRAARFAGLKGFFRGLERPSVQAARPGLPRADGGATRPCPACHGARLRPEALAVRIDGRNIAELSALTDPRSPRVPRRPGRPAAASRSRPACSAQVESRLRLPRRDRAGLPDARPPGASLSGGELQRVVLTKALGSGLVNTLYVLDEPTVGLHPQEVGRADRGPAPAARPGKHAGGRRARSRR